MSGDVGSGDGGARREEGVGSPVYFWDAKVIEPPRWRVLVTGTLCRADAIIDY